MKSQYIHQFIVWELLLIEKKIILTCGNIIGKQFDFYAEDKELMP